MYTSTLPQTVASESSFTPGPVVFVNPLLKGHLCEGRAFVALQLEDYDGFEHWKARTDTLFRSTGNPALIARIDRLNRARSAAGADGKLPPAESAEGSTTVRDDGQQTVTPTVADTPLGRVRAE